MAKALDRPPIAPPLDHVGVIIPALNEQASIGRVVTSLRVGQIIVVDNGSTDDTAAVAERAGATVVHEPRRGYGSACLAGIAALDAAVRVVAFLDADLADDPAFLPPLVAPVLSDETDLVIGARTRGGAEAGSLTLPQRLGNHIATCLLGVLCRARFTDLGPFRAIRRSALDRLAMDDTTYGWTVQMQLRAVRQKLRCREIAVPYYRRVGTSKISGTFRGVIGAGTRIPLTILRETLLPPRRLPPPPPVEQLAVFARLPEPGRTKTRLVPALGPEGAADLHHRMTAHTLEQVDVLTAARPALAAAVRYTGGAAARMAALFGPRRYEPQGEGDLGDRLHRTAADAFAEGAQRVVLIGTDCPALTPDRLHKAFDALREADLVIGPAHDGGYYLIGMNRTSAHLFHNIDWGTGDVLRQTLEAADRAGETVTLLAPLPDIDRPEDLPACTAAIDGPTLSVIIPTLNEQTNLPATLRRIKHYADANVELIVADGNSTDATPRIAADHGAALVTSPPGRARQMNAGAAAAQGDILLFCHADTLLPPDFAHRIRCTLRSKRYVGGAFALEIDAAGAVYRRIEKAVDFRTRRLHLPYGDQAIFVRRDMFDALGGYDPTLPAMEDYVFIRRLRRRGCIAALSAPALTSARYWQQHGPLGATLRNQLTLAAYHLGLRPLRPRK